MSSPAHGRDAAARRAERVAIGRSSLSAVLWNPWSWLGAAILSLPVAAVAMLLASGIGSEYRPWVAIVLLAWFGGMVWITALGTEALWCVRRGFALEVMRRSSKRFRRIPFARIGHVIFASRQRITLRIGVQERLHIRTLPSAWEDECEKVRDHIEQHGGDVLMSFYENGEFFYSRPWTTAELLPTIAPEVIEVPTKPRADAQLEATPHRLRVLSQDGTLRLVGDKVPLLSVYRKRNLLCRPGIYVGRCSREGLRLAIRFGTDDVIELDTEENTMRFGDASAGSVRPTDTGRTLHFRPEVPPLARLALALCLTLPEHRIATESADQDPERTDESGR